MLTLHRVLSGTLSGNMHPCISSGVCVHTLQGDGVRLVLLRGRTDVRVTVSGKSTYCGSVMAALCIRYFPLHLVCYLGS